MRATTSERILRGMLAVVGVGTNLGDRAATIRRALESVAKLPGARAAKASPIYETAPVGPPQPSYLNAAIAIELDPPRSARSLVAALLAVEHTLGRVRDGERFGPRTIDLDLLWTDAAPSAHDDAIVPHPRLHERAFALVPLVDVAPHACAPDGTKYAEILERIGRAGVTLYSSS